MTARTLATTAARTRPAALAVALFSGETKLPTSLKKLDSSFGGALSRLLRQADRMPPAGGAVAVDTDSPQRLFVLGMGDADAFHAGHLRVAGSKLVGMLRSANLRTIGFEAGDLPDAAAGCEAFAAGLVIGDFRFDAFEGTAAAANLQAVGRISIAVPAAALRKRVDAAIAAASAANLARELAATPPNVANPGFLATRCRKLAKQVGLRYSEVTAAKAKTLGMEGLLAVGRAGSSPPRIICLEHRPRGTAEDAPVLLVGKAVTFDTGGYSIKSAAGMVSMKYDKCGGTTVIGIMAAVAALKLPVRVVGLVPAAENMIGPEAYRPSDLLRLGNGVTVEVLNTDAEGRLILADALAWGCRTYKPRCVIDLATLTGAAVVALGNHCAGAFCNDQTLFEQIESAAETTGEKIWRLPLWPEHRKQIKATHADIANTGGRGAGASTAAAFLSYFACTDGDPNSETHLPWCHLDIAGVSDVEGDRDPSGLWAKGPTGFGVRLVTEVIQSLGQ